MSEQFVTHKELSTVLLQIQKENKDDRHAVLNKIATSIFQMETKIDKVHEGMDKIGVLEEKIKNNQKDFTEFKKEVKRDIHEITKDVSSISKKIWIAAGALGSAGGLGSYIAQVLIN